MARKKSGQTHDKELDRQFEKQGRRLNRKRMRNAVSGIVVLVVILVVLQFTPYRDIHLDIFNAAKNFVTRLTSGPAAPVEPDPQYW